MVTLAEKTLRQQDENVIRTVLRRSGFPAAVKGYEIEFGEDHSGDPAVWIWLLVREETEPSKIFLDELIPYARAIGRELVEAQLGHWPYVRFRTWVQSIT